MSRFDRGRKYIEYGFGNGVDRITDQISARPDISGQEVAELIKPELYAASAVVLSHLGRH